MGTTLMFEDQDVESTHTQCVVEFLHVYRQLLIHRYTSNYYENFELSVSAQRQFADAAAKPKALGQSTATQTPILYYNSTQQATSSINHRMFYVNVVGMIRCDRLIQ